MSAYTRMAFDHCESTCAHPQAVHAVVVVRLYIKLVSSVAAML